MQYRNPLGRRYAGKWEYKPNEESNAEGYTDVEGAGPLDHFETKRKRERRGRKRERQGRETEEESLSTIYRERTVAKQNNGTSDPGSY